MQSALIGIFSIRLPCAVMPVTAKNPLPMYTRLLLHPINCILYSRHGDEYIKVLLIGWLFNYIPVCLPIQLGYVKINLAEYAGAGDMQRKYLLESYNERLHKPDNSILKVKICLRQTSGDVLFKA